MSLPQKQVLQPDTTYPPVVPQSQPGDTVAIQVSVTPQKKVTPEGEIIILGYVQHSEVEVIFKRDQSIMPLLHALYQIIQAARRRSAETGKPMPHVSYLRCPLHVEGKWRVKVDVDDDEMPIRRYQLLATNWRLKRAKLTKGPGPN